MRAARSVCTRLPHYALDVINALALARNQSRDRKSSPSRCVVCIVAPA